MSRSTSDMDILELFAEVDEPRTTPKVAAQLGISKPATWKRLTDLQELGLLEKIQPSGLKGESWQLSDAGREVLEENKVPEKA